MRKLQELEKENKKLNSSLERRSDQMLISKDEHKKFLDSVHTMNKVEVGKLESKIKELEDEVSKG